MESQSIYEAVTSHYSVISQKAPRHEGKYSKAVAKAFGYTTEELDAIPADANLGLSCGNPFAIASLEEGEALIDFGSGAGFDVFLAANRVAKADMLALAEKNRIKMGAKQTEFIEGRISNVPLPDDTANIIVSNCVINLVPADEKHMVFKETVRLLKPGGRVATSDILARRPLPESLRTTVVVYSGCISGASLVEEYHTHLRNAGFEDVFIKPTGADLNIYVQALGHNSDTDKEVGVQEQEQASSAHNNTCCGSVPPTDAGCCSRDVSADSNIARLASELSNVDANEWAGSYQIYAVKPHQIL